MGTHIHTIVSVRSPQMTVGDSLPLPAPALVITISLVIQPSLCPCHHIRHSDTNMTSKEEMEQELRQLSYKQLQQKAKAAGISARQKASELVAALAALTASPPNDNDANADSDSEADPALDNHATTTTRTTRGGGRRQKQQNAEDGENKYDSDSTMQFKQTETTQKEEVNDKTSMHDDVTQRPRTRKGRTRARTHESSTQQEVTKDSEKSEEAPSESAVPTRRTRGRRAAAAKRARSSFPVESVATDAARDASVDDDAHREEASPVAEQESEAGAPRHGGKSQVTRRGRRGRRTAAADQDKEDETYMPASEERANVTDNGDERACADSSSPSAAPRPSMAGASKRRRWTRTAVELFGGAVVLKPPISGQTQSPVAKKQAKVEEGSHPVKSGTAIDGIVPSTPSGMDTPTTTATGRKRRRRWSASARDLAKQLTHGTAGGTGPLAQTPLTFLEAYRAAHGSSGLSSASSSKSPKRSRAMLQAAQAQLSSPHRPTFTPTTTAAAAAAAASILEPLPPARSRPNDVHSRLSFTRFPAATAHTDTLLEKSMASQHSSVLVPTLVEQTAAEAAAATASSAATSPSSTASHAPSSSSISFGAVLPLPETIFHTDTYHSGAFTMGVAATAAPNNGRQATRTRGSKRTSSSNQSFNHVTSNLAPLFSRQARSQRNADSTRPKPSANHQQPTASPFLAPSPAAPASSSRNSSSRHSLTRDRRFDLQQSLQRPVTWKMKTGKWQLQADSTRNKLAASKQSSSLVPTAASDSPSSRRAAPRPARSTQLKSKTSVLPTMLAGQRRAHEQRIGAKRQNTHEQARARAQVAAAAAQAKASTRATSRR